MHLNGDGLRTLKATTIGTGLDSISQPMVDAAQSDVFVRRSNMRRKVANDTPETQRALEPRDCMIFDCFGPVSAPSVVDGSCYELESSCEVTSYGYDMTFRRHTTDKW
eukprot:2544586-Prymnesium_polylepis.1